jgi:hypothetical protein
VDTTTSGRFFQPTKEERKKKEEKKEEFGRYSSSVFYKDSVSKKEIPETVKNVNHRQTTAEARREERVIVARRLTT